MAAKKKEYTVEERIKRETKRILKIFAGIDENKLAILQADIDNLAFFTVMWEEIRKNLIQKGINSRYQNGENQWGEKASTDAATIDKWALRIDNITGRLLSEVPEKQQESKLLAMMGRK